MQLRRIGYAGPREYDRGVRRRLAIAALGALAVTGITAILLLLLLMLITGRPDVWNWRAG
jgi:hypothetical protein